MKGLVSESCEGWLRDLGVCSLEERRCGGDLITLYNWLKGACNEVDIAFFSKATNNRGNGLKVCQGRFRLGIRRNFFTE